MKLIKTKDSWIDKELVYSSCDEEWIQKISSFDIKPLLITEENNYIFSYKELNSKFYEERKSLYKNR